MNLLKLQFGAAMLLLTLSGGFYTIGFFSDIERSLASVLSAAELDYEIAGEPLGGLMCSQTETVSTILYAGNVGRCDFEYVITVENLIGDFCNALDAKVSHGTTTLYEGALVDLFVASDVLPIGETEELLFELSIAPGATSTGGCAFETVSTAARIAGMNFGFTDEEVVSHYVYGSATGIGGGCVPPEDSVNLHLSKAISGQTLGYELSDFSYRVTGNGVDTIVPHDSTIALTEGTYTIEELVPEDFVKEDWRIGWYGECERGDTFFTTVTIDDGNIDHGTLYCQADNQYRPDQRRDRDDRNERSSRSNHERQEEPEVDLETGTSTESGTTTEPVGENDGNSGSDGADGADGTGGGATGSSTNESSSGEDGVLIEVEENSEEVAEVEIEPVDEAEEGTEEAVEDEVIENEEEGVNQEEESEEDKGEIEPEEVPKPEEPVAVAESETE